MICSKTIISIILFVEYGLSLAYEDIDFLKSEIELVDLELQDMFEDIAKARKTALQNGTYDTQINLEESLGVYLNENAKHLISLEEDGVPTELDRSFRLYTLPGDGLLSNSEYSQIVRFHNKLEKQKHSMKVPCVEQVKGCPLTVKEYHNILATKRNLDKQKLAWSRWQKGYVEIQEDYPNILQLVNKAALLNDMASATTYWETILDYEDAYSKADTFWEEIKPLYMKLHKFVNTRVANKYNLTKSETIPVYLLGTNFGNDWSNLADYVLPHPQIYFDAATHLNYQDIRYIYKLSENLTEQMSLGNFGKKFWSKSAFNSSSCDSEVLTYCSSGYTEVYECDSTSWMKYLDAHENALKIIINNMDFYSYPKINLRTPVISDILENVGSILAIEHLPYHSILEPEVFKSELSVNNTERMTELLLVALRVLPRLPYYLAVDKWRLQELQMPSQNIVHSWWEMRKQIQGVSGITNEEHDFLGDPFISSNKPYLGKFLGTIFAFQLLEQYRMKMSDPTDNIAKMFAQDTNLIDLIKARPTDEWLFLFNIFYGLSEGSTDALLEYFKPLEDYLDTAPIDQAPFTIKTTTTTTTSTTTSKPTVVTTETIVIKPIQADRPSEEVTEQNKTMPVKVIQKSNTGLYIVIGAIAVALITGVAYVAHKTFRPRPRTNNRRFEA